MKRTAVLIFVCGIAALSFAQIPTANLIAYYSFCGNANDMSGNGNNGTVIGASLTSDRFGNSNCAYTFNGTNNYINLPPASFTGLNAYSCSMWIRPTSGANAANIAYSVGQQSGPLCLSINYNPPGIFAGCYNNGSNPVQSYVTSNPIAGINTWVHVVVTRDMTNLKLYVNGVLAQQLATANTNSQSLNYGSSPYAAIIGARSNLQNFFPGQIDDVRIYSSVLTQNDVNALYNEPQFLMSVNSGSVCAGNSFTLSASGAVSYAYPAGSPVVSPASSTVYTVLGTNAGGCTAYATATVSVLNPATISVNSGSVCPGSSFTLVPGGAVSYTYPGGSPFVSPSSSTVYTVTGAGANGCVASATAAVSVLNAATISINSGTICRGGSFVLSANGAVSYSYSGGSPLVSPQSTTVYTITGVNAAGCTATATASVSVYLCTGIGPAGHDQPGPVIYPNPNAGEFTVLLPVKEGKECQLILRDLQGRIVKIFSQEISDKPFILSTGLIPGCYLAELTVDGKTIFGEKIIVLDE